MLNNFCLHLYAQKSLFISENGNDFFDIVLIILSCDSRVHRAGRQLKIIMILKHTKTFDAPTEDTVIFIKLIEIVESKNIP